MAKGVKKKKGTALAVFFVVWAVILIVALVTYSHFKTVRTPQPFNSVKKNSAAKLYENVMSYNLNEDYPDSPQVVMEIYNDTIHLIYGDMLRDDDVLTDIVEQQRMLLSPALLEENSMEEQIDMLKDNLEELRSLNIFCIDKSQKAPIFDRNNPSKCTVRAIQTFKELGEIQRNYYFVKNPSNGRWQIDEWDIVGQNNELPEDNSDITVDE